jgi:serine/threonine protein kinase
LKEPIAKYIFQQLMSVMIYLQDQEISHRDIKLENIMVDFNFNLKLIDFGLAMPNLNNLETYCGSLHYCAPEILQFSPYNGLKSDMWSCGVVLYSLLTGILPFDHVSNIKTSRFIKNCDYLIPKHISKSASNLIRSLLTLDVNQRLFPKEVLIHEWMLLNEMIQKIDIHSFS